MPNPKIGFIGAGQMASALACGFRDSGQVKGTNLIAYDVSQTAIQNFGSRLPGCSFTDSNQSLVDEADIVFLAVKPQVIPDVVGQIKVGGKEKLFVSIIGGITLDWLFEKLGTDQLIRTMPNTPCLIGKGAIGISPHPSVPSEQLDFVKKLFESVALTHVVAERVLDAVTGLSGSGPAFVFQFIEALSDGGVYGGLPRDVALQLAAQTVVGAGEMILQSGDHPALLKDRVASPAGTTIAGIKALEERGFRGATISAVEAATNRSKDLGLGSP